MEFQLKLDKKNQHIKRRTNRKTNFKRFFESDGTDLDMFKKACKHDENLMIYTCITDDELRQVINKLKDFNTIEEKLNYLTKNQPYMNENVERYDRCCDSLAQYLKGFIEYSAFKSANANGSYEDYKSEYWAKFSKVREFYRTRWFFPEKLTKKTTVVYSKQMYKEFLYVLRSSISSERKHIGFKATQDLDASIFKTSLDSKLDLGSGNKGNEKTLSEILPDQSISEETLFEGAHTSCMIDKALKICDKYPDGRELHDQIADFYEKQDTVGVDKKVVVLAKIFLYHAGLISPKVLQFIKGLSPTYKQNYNISNARLNKLILEYKPKKTVKIKSPKEKTKTENLGWKDLIIMRRGEI